jgi:hypothetical protein
MGEGESVGPSQDHLHAQAALSSCICMSSPNLLDDLIQTRWLLTPVTLGSSMGAPTQLLCDVRNPPSALGDQSRPLSHCTKIAAPGSPHGLLVHAERRLLADGNLPHAEASLSPEPHENKRQTLHCPCSGCCATHTHTHILSDHPIHASRSASMAQTLLGRDLPILETPSASAHRRELRTARTRTK